MNPSFLSNMESHDVASIMWQALRAGKAGGAELSILLSSAGACLAQSEKDEFQGIIDGVKGKKR